MTAPRFVRIAGLVLVGALAVTACGSDDDDGDDAAAEETTTTTVEETTTTTEAAPVDPTEEVTAAYTTFFENFKGDLALLEDGDTFADSAIQPMRERAAAAGSIKVIVQAVTALDDAGCTAVGQTPPCAEVMFDLSVAEDPKALPDQTGYAVLQDGTWKVAKSSFCGLAQLGGGLPEGC